MKFVFSIFTTNGKKSNISWSDFDIDNESLSVLPPTGSFINLQEIFDELQAKSSYSDLLNEESNKNWDGKSAQVEACILRKDNSGFYYNLVIKCLFKGSIDKNILG
ncbi:hypothetical protein AD998_01835 [bacterium 336/3]|nr:hypothetical protein AD998_01835 [bacterium 336/3]